MNKLDQLDELAFVIMLLLGILFIAAMFGNNNEYRKDLRERVEKAREQAMTKKQIYCPDRGETDQVNIGSCNRLTECAIPKR